MEVGQPEQIAIPDEIQERGKGNEESCSHFELLFNTPEVYYL